MSSNHSPLQIARELTMPSRESMLQRTSSVEQFWNHNQSLLNNAWNEWEESFTKQLPCLDDSLLDANLRQTVMQAWKDPSKENEVRKLWREVAPDVFECQFFDPQRLDQLRDYLDQAANAQIPIRPPYGIALNRRGAMLDRRSLGYLAGDHFQAFYREMLDTYMRPVARMLYPEIVGYDSQTFGFSIGYQANTDTSLRLHTDASAVTLNININLPGEGFTGSKVDFYDPSTGKMIPFTFKPGTAVIHRGNVAHAAHPILSGERTNIVLWLFGEQGQIPPHEGQRVDIDPRKRWSVPTAIQDDYAPF